MLMLYLFQSYCPRHTAIRKTPSKLLSPGLDGPLEMTPLQLVEEEFYKYASPEELSNELSLSIQISSLIYNYWKLKRKVINTTLIKCYFM